MRGPGNSNKETVTVLGSWIHLGYVLLSFDLEKLGRWWYSLQRWARADESGDRQATFVWDTQMEMPSSRPESGVFRTAMAVNTRHKIW
jgi:hypothetical protein